MPENINELLSPDYLEIENGYCQLPQGAAYVAVLTKMPGISADMFKWYDIWKQKEDLRYKIWHPPTHFMLGPNWLMEDIGYGPCDIYLVGGGSLEDLGFDKDLFIKSKVTLAAGTGLSKPCGASPTLVPRPIIVCHVIRSVPDGIEFRSRFWLGYQSNLGGGPKVTLRPGIVVPEIEAYQLAQHCAWEFANLRSFLPQLFEEESNSEPDVWTAMKEIFQDS